MRGLRISICVTNLHSKSAQQICVIRDIYVRGVSLFTQWLTSFTRWFHRGPLPRDGRERGSRPTCVRVRDARSRNRGNGVRGLSTPEISAMTSS